MQRRSFLRVKLLVLLLIGLALIWLPMFNTLADTNPDKLAFDEFLFASSILASIGIAGLLVLNYSLQIRRLKHSQRSTFGTSQ